MSHLKQWERIQKFQAKWPDTFPKDMKQPMLSMIYSEFGCDPMPTDGARGTKTKSGASSNKQSKLKVSGIIVKAPATTSKPKTTTSDSQFKAMDEFWDKITVNGVVTKDKTGPKPEVQAAKEQQKNYLFNSNSSSSSDSAQKQPEPSKAELQEKFGENLANLVEESKQKQSAKGSQTGSENSNTNLLP